MKGIEISKAYFEEYGRPMLAAKLAARRGASPVSAQAPAWLAVFVLA